MLHILVVNKCHYDKEQWNGRLGKERSVLQNMCKETVSDNVQLRYWVLTVYTFLFTAYPVQCYWQFHSDQLVGLSKLPPVSSMLAPQLFAPDPLSVATQLAHLQESLGSLSRAWVGCSRDLEWDPGWILLFYPVSGGRWWCQQGSLYLSVSTIYRPELIPVVALHWQL